MITYSFLGKNGRLGNQLFQCATLFSVGFTRGYEIGIPKDQTISSVFSLESFKQIEKRNFSFLYKEKDFVFDASVFLVPDETDLFGYFQSGNYFNHCDDALRKEFKFQKNFEEKATIYLQNCKNTPLCSLHVRRGDYKNLSSYHTNLGSDYYNQACSAVLNSYANCKFLVFSDDIAWCKQIFTDEKFTIVETGDDALDLCIMSKCDIHIIANSSFSWWGAWLSKSRAVIAPKQWFGPSGPKSWNTVYQQGWLLI